jgi:hypothetical protein
MDPILDELAQVHAGRIKFTKLNVDENLQTATRYDIVARGGHAEEARAVLNTVVPPAPAGSSV